MNAPQPESPRYWITRESQFTTVLGSPSSYFSQPGDLIFTEHLNGMQPGDVVYVYRPEEGYQWWGYIDEVIPASDEGYGDDDEEPSYPEEYLETIEASGPRPPHAGGPNLLVSAKSRQFISPALGFNEITADLAVLQQPLLKPEIRGAELTPAQAAAFNQLIRSRVAELPPVPGATEADAEDEGDGHDDEEETTRLTLREVFERYKLSELPRAIIEKAADFARRRRHHQYRVTTSCLLFAASELGISDKRFTNAAQYLYTWLRENRGVQVYRPAFDAFMNTGGGPEVVDLGREVVLTRGASAILETARWLAEYVRVDDIEVGRETIHGRDLVAALLMRADAHVDGGAATRLRLIGVNARDIIRGLFKDHLSHRHNRDDEVERWEAVLIGGQPLPREPRVITPEPPRSYLPRIDADAADGEDLLNITAEVNGFASIIAARDVKTPLSIGLFGDWGAGKSFFMSKLKRRVAEIAREVKAREGDESSYLANVVQIDFNAWHYVEANLWASLVTHVFDNLNLTDEKNRDAADERKRFLLAQLDTTLRARRAASESAEQEQENVAKAVAELGNKRAELKSAEGDLAAEEKVLRARRRAQAEAKAGLGSLLRGLVWPRVREAVRDTPGAEERLREAYGQLGLDAATENLEEARRLAADALTTAGRARVQFEKIFNSRGVRRRVFWLVVVLVVVPVVVFAAFAYLGGRPEVASLIAWAGEGLALLVGAFRVVKPKVVAVVGAANDVLKQVAAANAELDELHREARGRHEQAIKAQEQVVKERQEAVAEKAEEVVAQRAAVEARRAAVEEARRRLDEAEQQQQETLAALAEMDPARMLARFIEERASSTDYRQHLGIVALVHKDFKTLSDLLVGQDDNDGRRRLRDAIVRAFEDNGVTPPADTVERELKKYRIDRIVLYIDDLDRCPPRQVVDVLQAIHLLLAFKLFVVVVGVDARWVRHSLHEQFPKMLSGGDDDGVGAADLTKAARPRDYIEKIFQVPFWLRPMNPRASAKLLEGLIPDAELHPETQGAPPPKDASPSGNGTGAGARVESSPETTPAAASGAGVVARPNVAAQTAAAPAAGGATGGAGPATPATKAEGASGGQTHGGDGEEFVLKPNNLYLRRKERDTMVRLSKVIGRTPRTLKRFVNVYRIIKAGLRGRQLAAFVGRGKTDGEYRAVLLLLGVAHGAPEHAAEFFRRLRLAQQSEAGGKEVDIGLRPFLQEQFEKTPVPGVRVPGLKMRSRETGRAAAWNDFVAELHEFLADEEDIPLEVLSKWAPVVLRYTFQLGRMAEEFESEESA